MFEGCIKKTTWKGFLYFLWMWFLTADTGELATYHAETQPEAQDISTVASSMYSRQIEIHWNLCWARIIISKFLTGKYSFTTKWDKSKGGGVGNAFSKSFVFFLPHLFILIFWKYMQNPFNSLSGLLTVGSDSTSSLTWINGVAHRWVGFLQKTYLKTMVSASH